MANTERTVRVRFDGSATGLSRAARQAERDLERLQRKANNFSNSTAKIAGLTGLVGAVGALGGPAVAGGIAALGSLGAAGGVLALAFSGVGDAVDEFNKALESGDYSKYEAALARMPKSQADFTRELVKTKQEFGRLKTTAADNALPGISDALRSTIDLLPILDRSVGRTGRLISDTGRDLGKLFRTEEFQKDLDGFLKALDPVTKAAGDTLVSLTGRLVKFGSEMRPASEGFASFLRGLTDGVNGFLDELAPHAEDFKLVWESLGDIVREILPIAGSFIGDLSETWGPVLRDVADWLGENRDEIKQWGSAIASATPYLLGLAVAWKAFKAAGSIADTISTASSALGGFGGKADDANRKLGRKGGGGLIGGLAAAAAGFALLDAASEVKIELPQIDGATFESNIRSATSQLGAIFDDVVGGNFSRAWRRAQIFVSDTPIQIKFDTMGANGNLESFLNKLNQSKATVAVDGNVVPLGDAVLRITDAINAGREYVTIDGQTMPARDALTKIKDDINLTQGLVNINGNTLPAGDALFAMLSQIEMASGTLTINGDQMPATEALQSIQAAINSGQGTVLINGNSYPAMEAKSLVEQAVNMSTPTLTINGRGMPALDALRTVESTINNGGGTVTIDGVAYPADQARRVIEGRINTTTGTLGITAQDRGAAGTANSIKGNIDRTTGTINVQARDTNSRSVLSQIQGVFGGVITQTVRVVKSFFGFADGGPLAGFATGGAIHGPGTGTSDSILGMVGRTPIRLSNGEHILTAREVAAAGGHAGVYALRAALLAGRVATFATGGSVGTRAATQGLSGRPSAAQVAGQTPVLAPQFEVAVYVGDRELTDIVDVQITESNRQLKRTVGAGRVA